MWQILWISVLMGSVMAYAQRGPNVPCPECKDYPSVSYPETGWWYNPAEPGTGFNIEVQNGYLLGAYYGFDDQGLTVWYLFQGELQPGEEGVFYRLDAELQHYVGGSCLSCPHMPVMPAESPGSISIEFRQRNHASFSLSGEHEQFIVPLVYGAAASVDFPEGEYSVPELTGFWTVVVENPDPDYGPQARWGRRVEVLRFGNKGVTLDGHGNVIRTRYTVFEYPSVPEVRGVATFDCRPTDDVTGAPPECVLTYTTTYPGSEGLVVAEFQVPLANIGDSRIEGATADGIRLIASRLDYD